MNESRPATLDVQAIRAEFPVLAQRVHDAGGQGRPLAYLDNAATTQKPLAVIDAVRDFYLRDNANVHRGVHALSERATAAYEGAREKVRAFIGAESAREIIFVRGTTEAINLVAAAWGRANVREGDEILITGLEHHSNIVPWQMLRDAVGAKLVVAPINRRGEVDMEAFERLLSPRTKLVAISHLSNALGTINPVERMISLAHDAGALALVDGAQAAAHLDVDVRRLDADFYAMSAHKMYGPTGIGALYGKREILETMPPWQGGGDMISMVTFDETRYNELPYRFEAGTPHIAGAIGFGHALDWLERVGVANIAAHETRLLDYATERARAFPGLTIIGEAAHKASILSFTLEGVHPHDLGTILDREGVAIRAGHHCAMPVMDFFGVPATARASFAAYNTREEVDALFAALEKARELFA